MGPFVRHAAELDRIEALLQEQLAEARAAFSVPSSRNTWDTTMRTNEERLTLLATLERGLEALAAERRLAEVMQAIRCLPRVAGCVWVQGWETAKAGTLIVRKRAELRIVLTDESCHVLTFERNPAVLADAVLASLTAMLSEDV